MKILMFFLLLSFTASESSTLVNKNNHEFTSTYHYLNNISLKNFDGTRSTVYVSGNSATLMNSDGTQSTIDFCGNSSTLIAIDGTSASIFHNGISSTVFNSDGTQIIVSHMQSTSLCYTENGKHMIMHTFGDMRERRHKNKIDVLIHMNWLLQKKAIKAMDELDKEEGQN